VGCGWQTLRTETSERKNHFSAACDDHAAAHKPTDMLWGYSNGEGGWLGSRFTRDEPGMHTIDGARVRDIDLCR